MISKKKIKLKYNKLGILEVTPLPTSKELNKYYNKYYDLKNIHYKKKYSNSELEFKTTNAKIANYFIKPKSKILEIGCGEGYACKYFLEKGHKVFAIDYKKSYFSKNNEKTLKKINFKEIQNESTEKSYDKIFNTKFDCIFSELVGEHVLDIRKFFENSYNSIKKNGYFILTVPNDNNKIFRHYIKINGKQSIVQTKTYSPEHLRFFDKKSLKKSVLRIFKSISNYKIISSYPIERFLINKKYDYYKNNTGKIFWDTVVDFTNFLYERVDENLINYLESQANLNIGRDLTIIIKK